METPIKGFEKYTCSKDGVISHIRTKRTVKPVTNKTTGYSQVCLYLREGEKRKRRSVTVHTVIWRALKGNVPKGLEIDHIDGDKGNNHPSNLRLCTKSQNLTRRNIPSSLGFRGVYKEKRKLKKPFLCTFREGGKKRTLGRFLTAEEAALAYNQAAIEKFGGFAVLNVIPHLAPV